MSHQLHSQAESQPFTSESTQQPLDQNIVEYIVGSSWNADDALVMPLSNCLDQVTVKKNEDFDRCVYENNNNNNRTGLLCL